MAKNYSFERGKYGLTTGTIVPFGILVQGEFPDEGDWSRFFPAGYLRCRGQILRARDYIALSQILGVGSSCKYKKEDRELQEASDDLTEGQFQLPDYGSKYMRATAASGVYNNITVIDPSSGKVFTRSGLEVDLTLNQGSTIEILYSGSIVLPTTPIPFSSSANFVSTLPSVVDESTVSDDQCLSHGHYSNSAVKAFNDSLDTRNDAPFQVTGDDVATADPPLSQASNTNDVAGSGYDVDAFTVITQIGGDSLGTTHTHTLSKSPISKSISSNVSRKEIQPSNIVTTINLSSSNIFKMDDIQHKFIIVEYLIKI